MPIRAILIAFQRALLSQFHFRMLLLTLVPFLMSLLLWAVLLWLGLQRMIDWLHAWFLDTGSFKTAGELLGGIGLDALKVVLVPLAAMWVLLPLMIITALVFVGAFAMPAIIRHVSSRHYPLLERRHGGSFWGSLGLSSASFAVFAVLWIVSLPLNLIPPLTFIIQPFLWGWLTYRVMSYDALAEHAARHERQEIMRRHRWPLLAIGTIGGAFGAAPTLLWLGGAFAVVLFPLMAGISIWLYVLVFVFTGLWFEHYCLEALDRLRDGTLGGFRERGSMEQKRGQAG